MADINYDIESLERSIEAAKRNIVTFEAAIQREKDTINEYQGYIDILNEKKMVKKGIIIDAREKGVSVKNDEEKE